jgi:hypothetical protein
VPQIKAIGTATQVGKNSIDAENTNGNKRIAQKILWRGVLIIRLSPDVGWICQSGEVLRR